MKRNLKPLLILLALVLVITPLAACGGGGNGSDVPTPQNGGGNDSGETASTTASSGQLATYTLSEFLASNDPVVFFSGHTQGGGVRPSIFYFHNGQLLVAEATNDSPTFSEFASMTDDEILVAAETMLQHHWLIARDSLLHEMRMDGVFPRLEVLIATGRDGQGYGPMDTFFRLHFPETFNNIVGEALPCPDGRGEFEGFSASQLGEILALGLEYYEILPTITPPALFDYFSTPYFLSVLADGGQMTLAYGRMGWAVGRHSYRPRYGQVYRLNIPRDQVSWVIDDTTFVGFGGRGVFVTRVAGDEFQIVESLANAEGIEQNPDAAEERLQEELLRLSEILDSVVYGAFPGNRR